MDYLVNKENQLREVGLRERSGKIMVPCSDPLSLHSSHVWTDSHMGRVINFLEVIIIQPEKGQVLHRPPMAFPPEDEIYKF